MRQAKLFLQPRLQMAVCAATGVISATGPLAWLWQKNQGNVGFCAATFVILAAAVLNSAILAGAWTMFMQRARRALVFYPHTPQYRQDVRTALMRWSLAHTLQLAAPALLYLEPQAPPVIPMALFLGAHAGILTRIILTAAGRKSLPPAQTRRRSSDDPVLHLDYLQPDNLAWSQFSISPSVPILKKRMGIELRNAMLARNTREITLTLKESQTSKEPLQIAIGTPEDQRGAQGEISILLDNETVLRKPLGMLTAGWNDFLDLKKQNQTEPLRTITLRSQGCSDIYVTAPRRPKKPTAPKNIIIIILDGVRKDFLGLYNPQAKNTPEIDRFFKDYTRFENAVIQGEWTLPVFASMATSLYSSHHRVTNRNYSKNVLLPLNQNTFAEILQQNGYFTWAYMTFARSSQHYGHARGYDQFYYEQGAYRNLYRDMTQKALEALHHHKGENKFLFLHYTDAHPPFPLSPPFTSRGTALMTEKMSEIWEKSEKGESNPQERFFVPLYENKIREIDFSLGLLFSFIERTPLKDQTAVLLSSDHGLHLPQEGLSCWTDKHLNDARLAVPMLARVPWEPRDHKKTYDGLVESNIDLYPTVLALAGINAPHSPYSKSFLSTNNQIFQGKSHAVSELIYEGEYQCRIVTETQEYLKKFNWLTKETNQDLHDRSTGAAGAKKTLQDFDALTRELKLFQLGENPEKYY